MCEVDLIEYEATAKLYLQGIGEIQAGQRFRASSRWVDVLRYVARPVQSSVGGGLAAVESQPPSFSPDRNGRARRGRRSE